MRLNDRNKRQLEFIDKQLRDLYSPAVSLLREIGALSDLRLRIEQTADDTGRDLIEGARIIHYDNEQLREVLLPKYRKMLEVLHASFYLANESRRQQLPLLVEFVELWTRHLDDTIPNGVLANLEVREKKLQPLYDDLQTTFGALRSTLASGEAISLWSEIHKLFNTLSAQSVRLICDLASRIASHGTGSPPSTPGS